MNSEEDEFRRIEREALRQAQAAEDDDTQGYVSEFPLPNERNFCPRCGKRTKDIHTCTPPQQQAAPVAWAVQACSKMWRGEFAEIDAKAEAKRIGGTCVAYPLYTAQREWAGLTDEDWEKVANRKNTVLDTFEQGAVWAETQLRERNK